MKKIIMSFTFVLAHTLLNATTTQDSYKRNYTCNGLGVDCIFNVGADMTSARSSETNPTAMSFKRLKRFTSTLAITNNSGTTVAVWPVLSFAPATVIARVPQGRTAELSYTSYINSIYVVDDELMQQVGMETKNGPAAFQAALTKADPSQTLWTVEIREPFGLYHRDPAMTATIADASLKTVNNTITASVVNAAGKLVYRALRDTIGK